MDTLVASTFSCHEEYCCEHEWACFCSWPLTNRFLLCECPRHHSACLPFSCINCCEHSSLECSRSLITRAEVLGKEGFWLQAPSLCFATFSARGPWVSCSWQVLSLRWGSGDGGGSSLSSFCLLMGEGTNLRTGCLLASQQWHQSRNRRGPQLGYDIYASDVEQSG